MKSVWMREATSDNAPNNVDCTNYAIRKMAANKSLANKNYIPQYDIQPNTPC
jgi:hypothetical protein